MNAKFSMPDRNHLELIGRDKELQTIISWLARSRFFIFSIGGMGGIGKTALALECCHYFQKEYERLPKEERFDSIVWTSAKFEDMTPTGRVQKFTYQSLLRDILTKIAEVLEVPEALIEDEDRQMDIISNALSKQRVLLVIDSFEQLENPEPIIQFIQDLQSPTRVLITTRPQQIIEGARPLFLNGLNEEEGFKLIKSLYNNAPVKNQLSEGEQRDLYTYTTGIPLAITWALGRILQLEEPYSGVISKLKRGVEDLSDYCIADSFQSIKGRKAEEIALTLLPLTTPINRQVIGEIVDLSKEIKVRDDELNLLLVLQLVIKNREDKFKIAPFTQTYLKENYEDSKLAIVREKWAKYYFKYFEELLGKHGRVDSLFPQG